MIHIGIDGNEANIKNKVGVNVYGFELLKNIHKLQDDWKDKFTFTIFLSSPPDGLPIETPNWKYKVLPGRGLWILRKLTPHLLFSKNKPDIFFTPSHYIPPFVSIPRICSIMDLGYLEYSGQFKAYDYWQLKLWSAYSIMVSKYIISISNTTKADILKHYPNSKGKVIPISLGYDKSLYNKNIKESKINAIKTKFTTGQDYVLFLGTLKPSKNIEGLIEAWASVAEDFPKTKLVIAGKKGWLYKTIFQKAKDLKITNKVVFTGFIPKGDKPALIAGARVFALPSFWEGFGLDVLSAFAVGTPVICSFKGSLPEVAGKAGIQVDPKNIDEIAKNIKSVLTMSKIDYNKLVKRGFSQAEKFSWEKTAAETLEVFEKCTQTISK